MLTRPQYALLLGLLGAYSLPVLAGSQQEERLAARVATSMHRAIVNTSPPRLMFSQPTDGTHWLTEMSARISPWVSDPWLRTRLLTTVHYEASRAGLNPQLVLAIIHTESHFRPYAISEAGAQGIMQVMPFWKTLLGGQQHSLFDLQTNLRFGCTIFRHYLDQSQGDLARALNRYNGSKASDSPYSREVIQRWQTQWQYTRSN